MTTAATTAHALEIPRYLPPTTNALMRGTLRRRMRLGRECRDLVAGYFARAGIPRAEGRRRVSLVLTLAPRNRGRDVDGRNRRKPRKTPGILLINRKQDDMIWRTGGRIRALPPVLNTMTFVGRPPCLSLSLPPRCLSFKGPTSGSSGGKR